jgi:glycosyltransferase involved in cell wall biosynthesis
VRIAVHAGTLRGFGSKTIGRSLLPALFEAEDDHEFIVWVPREWDWQRRDFGRRVEICPTAPGLAAKFVLENVAIRRALRRHAVDALISLGDTSLPGCSRPHLLFVQQAYLAFHPSQLPFRASPALRARMRVMALYFRLALPTVRRIVVQTHDMARRMAHRFGLPRRRLAVVPSAVDVPEGEGAAVRTGPVDPPYVCYVASAGPHKNHRVLPDMMAALRHHHPDLHCRLTISPEARPELVHKAEARGVRQAFVFEGPVSRQRTFDLYRGAVALVMPSKLESFGLPFYEAMAVGCPVVAADLPFAREACGSAGQYAHPDRGDEFAHQVDRLLRSELFADQQSQGAAMRFREVRRSWPEVAADFLDLVRCIR